MAFKPKFISFDCYGTLINFEMGPSRPARKFSTTAKCGKRVRPAAASAQVFREGALPVRTRQ
jgi:hypothetical protein